MLSTLKAIFGKNNGYIKVYIITGAIYLAIRFAQNYSFIASILSNDLFSLSGKLSIISKSLSVKITPFLSPELYLSDTLIIVSSLLVAILIILLKEFTYTSLKNNRDIQMLTFFGSIFSILGLGCIACGPTIIAALISGIGGISLIALLPFHGLEIAFIGNILLLFSIIVITKRLQSNGICTV